MKYRKKKRYNQVAKKKYGNSRYRGTVARIPKPLALKPKSVCQKFVYYNTLHMVPGLNSLTGSQQNSFFKICLNSPWPFINGWNSHAINNGRYLNENTPINSLGSNQQPDVNTTAMPGLKDGYNLFHQYQNGVVVGCKVIISAQPTGRTNSEDAEQSGVLYAVRHAKADFGLNDQSTIPQHQFSITCGLCKHHTLLEVANLIAVVGGDTTAHEVRQRARCQKCSVSGNNTYQMV